MYNSNTVCAHTYTTQKEDWAELFVKSGGLQHCCTVLNKQDTLTGDMAKKCILALLEIIHVLLRMCSFPLFPFPVR